MRREACVIAAGDWADSRVLIKNRDRNYKPNLRIVHTRLEGVEVAYLEDLGTGWIEGINEFGIGIVNSALLVGRDEAEKKLVKEKGKKSQDGARILKALTKKTLSEALKSLQTFQGGIKGHTILSDATSGWSLEMTSKHTCVTKPLKDGRIHVRTNHGLEYEDAGYTDGKDYLSSVVRRETALRVLDDVEKVEDIAPALMSSRKKDRKHPNNIVRDTDNMFTSSQMVLDLTHKRLLLYLVKGKQSFKEVSSELEGKAKIKVQVFDYDAKGKANARKASRIGMAQQIAASFTRTKSR